MDEKGDDARVIENTPHDLEVAVAAPEDDGKITFKTKLAIFALIVMYESYLFTQFMPASLLAYINAEVGPDPRYPWIAITWNLGASIIVTIGSRLSDIMGRRWFLICGAVLAAVGGIVGATSNSITQSIISGVLFGVGGGFQELCFACAQELVPQKYRFHTLSIMTFANHISSQGILIGYVFVAYTKPRWRSMYWWCFAWEAFTALLLFFCYHPPTFEQVDTLHVARDYKLTDVFRTKHKEDKKTKLQLMKELDYLGLILFTAGCLFVLLGLNWGGGLYPWKSGHVIGTIIAGALCFVALGFWEAYMPLKYPILPPHLFKEYRRFTAFIIVCFVAGMMYYSLNVIWPPQSKLLFVQTDNTIIRGVYASLVVYGNMAAAYYCALVMPWIKYEKWQIVCLFTIETALLGSMASVGPSDKVQAIIVVIAIQLCNLPPSPLSFGMVSLHLTDQTDIGVAVGLISTFRLIGGAVATAIYSSIQTSRFTSILPGMVREAAEASDFSGSIAQLIGAASAATPNFANVRGMDNATIGAVTLAVRDAHVKAYQLIYLVAIPFGVVAITAALTIKSIEPWQRSHDVAAHLENDKWAKQERAHEAAVYEAETQEKRIKV